ncbi:hypothetical protein [Methylobacterium sp. J-077]|uniref:hypothetical protein n=1 Tax=Methylobacterium sp. J-077 TaxID=2836656 RepID=UPI001FB8666A|nr:hypothetical protein [Methylobacterium sp. J-077]MCJ2121801.1 hypothetical protein [Methylobacterium sp. J-077]
MIHMKSQLLIIIALSLAGCARERINIGSSTYYKDLSKLQKQEVIDNIDATIDDPYRIPSRTTFGRGNITATDNDNLNVAFPFNPLPTNAGTATLGLGQYLNTYQIALIPEIRGNALNILRDIYRSAVYPGLYGKSVNVSAVVHARSPWLFWTYLDGSQASNEEPLPYDAVFIGVGQNHRIYTTDQDAFGKFILLTLGHVDDVSSQLRLEVPLGGTPYPSASKTSDKNPPEKNKDFSTKHHSGSGVKSSGNSSKPERAQRRKPIDGVQSPGNAFEPELTPFDSKTTNSDVRQKSTDVLPAPLPPGGNDPTVRSNEGR